MKKIFNWVKNLYLKCVHGRDQYLEELKSQNDLQRKRLTEYLEQIGKG
jgi:hypothetical protein